MSHLGNNNENYGYRRLVCAPVHRRVLVTSPSKRGSRWPASLSRLPLLDGLLVTSTVYDAQEDRKSVV